MPMEGRSKRSKEEIAAGVAAKKKAFEKERMSRPSKDKIAQMRNDRISTNKLKPAVKPKVTPKPKPKGLNDYLDKGKTPPSRNKKLPSDADVILKGYNDKKTIAKLKTPTKKPGK
jgi:hypothetical protein